MGCPIRKFPDQSLFAAPRNLSQRTTSFIASQRQGIRRIPFRHLIVLEIRKRTIKACDASQASTEEARLGRRASIPFLIEKTSFASNTSGSPRSGGAHDWYAIERQTNKTIQPQAFARACQCPSFRSRISRLISLVAETGCASSSQCHGTGEGC